MIAQTYTWDYENRLKSVTEAGTGTFAYGYDHRTRRVLRDESQAGGQSTVLSFSGGLSVQEYLSGGSTPTVEYIRGSDYGGGIGGVLYTIRGGNRSFNAYNSRGDVVSQTDDSGAITWQSSYEAFGTRTQEQGATEDRQKANTKDEDPTGLLNEHFRYRDLEFGVFISRDPAGLIDGPNTYGFVGNNPWTFFDPLGLNEVVISGGINEDPDRRDDHDSNWKNFITSAKLEIEERQKSLKEGESIEWHVQKGSYNSRELNDEPYFVADQQYVRQIELMGKELGVEVRFYESARDLVEAINHNTDGSKRTGKQKISRLAYFGHGAPGKLTTHYETGDGITSLEVASGVIDKKAFAKGATAKSWACNSATPVDFITGKYDLNGAGFSETWSNHLGVPMVGAVGRTNYAPTAAAGNKEKLSALLRYGSNAPNHLRQLSMPTLGTQSYGPNEGAASYWINPPKR